MRTSRYTQTQESWFVQNVSSVLLRQGASFCVQPESVRLSTIAAWRQVLDRVHTHIHTYNGGLHTYMHTYMHASGARSRDERAPLE